MSQSSFGTGGPSEEDERPIIGHFDSKDFVCGLRDYVTSMKDCYPDDPEHPSEDWLSQGIEMILLEQGRTVTSAPKQGTFSVGGQKAGGPASSQQSPMQRKLAAMTTGVANLWLGSKMAHQTQRTKDKTFRVHAFSNKAAQFHAEDLFDLERCALELAKLVKGLTPYLTSTICLTRVFCF